MKKTSTPPAKREEEEIKKILLEQYPDNVFKGKWDRIGEAYGRGQTLNRIKRVLHSLHSQAYEEGKREAIERVKKLTADEFNGDYTKEEQANPLIAYNAAIKDVLLVLKGKEKV